MLTGDNINIREVGNLSDSDRVKIASHLIQLVNGFIGKNGNKWFAARDLVGGENTYWAGTDIEIVYQRFIDKGHSHDKAHKQAGKDIGNLLKKALKKDTKSFTTCYKNRCRNYKLN